MRNYVIAVGSPEISRKVQEALFSAGFRWAAGGQTVERTQSAFICLHYTGNGCLSSGSGSNGHSSIVTEGASLISSQDAIANPFQFDGATKPVKEVTMEDLEKHYGCRVKITKKTTN